MPPDWTRWRECCAMLVLRMTTKTRQGRMKWWRQLRIFIHR